MAGTATAVTAAPTGEAEVPPEVWQLVGHFGLAAGNANVIMQLARLPVGHGVAHSKVDSGRVDKHPIKRLRTSSSSDRWEHWARRCGRCCARSDAS